MTNHPACWLTTMKQKTTSNHWVCSSLCSVLMSITFCSCHSQLLFKEAYVWGVKEFPQVMFWPQRPCINSNTSQQLWVCLSVNVLLTHRDLGEIVRKKLIQHAGNKRLQMKLNGLNCPNKCVACVLKYNMLHYIFFTLTQWYGV